MPGRVAARLLTGPLAFLLGGVIDTVTFVVAAARQRVRRSTIQSDAVTED